MNTNFPIITKTKEIHKSQFGLNCLVGSSILFQADYSRYSSNIRLGAATDILRKEYFISVGYQFQF